MPTIKNNFQLKILNLRKDIVQMIHEAASGHPGTSLSCLDVIAVLYDRILRHDVKRPEWEDRDRFILSKGHGVPALYAVLADQGYIKREELLTLRQLNSRLQGHPDKSRLAVMEASTGSLGQGLSIGIGMALARKLSGKDYHTFVLLGDGECEEGQVWEAIAYAGYNMISRLTCIVDENGFQLDDATKEILSLEPMQEKFEAFGWEVMTIKGHDPDQIFRALKESKQPREKPFAIIAQTIKGKGISFMENNNHYHGVATSDEEYQKAMKELDQEIQQVTNAAGSGAN